MTKTLIQVAQYCDPMFCDLLQATNEKDHKIRHLRIDSRKIQTNDIFIARQGQKQNGSNYIAQAIKNGAKVIICNRENQAKESVDLKNKVRIEMIHQTPILFCEWANFDMALPNFVEWFYDAPSQKLPLIGITGTNGKTTITQLIQQWAKLLGKKVGTIGTLGYSLDSEILAGTNTTPDLVEIDDWLAYCLNKQADSVAMEVSSHGLALERVQSLHFETAVFTNLTRDHLDFHQTLEAYAQAKWGLFSDKQTELKVASVNHKVIQIDDEVGQVWAEKLPDSLIVSIDPKKYEDIKKQHQYFVCATKLDFKTGVCVHFDSHLGEGILSTSLMGAFNASNLLLAFAALLTLNYPFESLVKFSAKLIPICGRMETFKLANNAIAIVDYAHTPDALEKALKAIKTHAKSRILTLFGCGGNRDKGKRKLMAQVAEQLSDIVILTDDNPREEESACILGEIKQGFEKMQPIVIADRKQAIEYGLTELQSDDVLLIAGKGHEDYQIIGTTKHPFSDQLVIVNWIKQAKFKH